MAYSKKVTATGSVVEHPCRFHGMYLGTDGTNDPVVTIEDRYGDKNDGEVIPTATYDASALGLNGVTGFPDDGRYCNYGIYCTITCAGAVEVVILYS